MGVANAFKGSAAGLCRNSTFTRVPFCNAPFVGSNCMFFTWICGRTCWVVVASIFRRQIQVSYRHVSLLSMSKWCRSRLSCKECQHSWRSNGRIGRGPAAWITTDEALFLFAKQFWHSDFLCQCGMIPHEDIQVLNVSLLATNPPSVRLIDWQLPRRGGFKVPVGREVWGFWEWPLQKWFWQRCWDNDY